MMANESEGPHLALLYEQGSKTCLHYSESTMKVRTLAQHVLIAYAVGLAIAAGKVTEPTLPFVMMGPSFVLVVFAIVLWLLNRHHSSAFREIRDRSLVEIEQQLVTDPSHTGPWQAHKKLRDEQQAGRELIWAWDAPFLALALIGLCGTAIGAGLKGGTFGWIVLPAIGVVSIGLLTQLIKYGRKTKPPGRGGSFVDAEFMHKENTCDKGATK